MAPFKQFDRRVRKLQVCKMLDAILVRLQEVPGCGGAGILVGNGELLKDLNIACHPAILECNHVSVCREVRVNKSSKQWDGVYTIMQNAIAEVLLIWMTHPPRNSTGTLGLLPIWDETGVSPKPSNEQVRAARHTGTLATIQGLQREDQAFGGSVPHTACKCHAAVIPRPSLSFAFHVHSALLATAEMHHGGGRRGDENPESQAVMKTVPSSLAWNSWSRLSPPPATVALL